MNNKKILEIARNLASALVSDFRGFLVDGMERIDVPEGLLHAFIAKEELEKRVPCYVYESGVGQDPIVEFMNFCKSIYVTKIGESNRSIAISKNVYNGTINYNGSNKYEYEFLSDIALSLGYDVDVYTLLERENNGPKTRSKIEHSSAQDYQKKIYHNEFKPTRTLKEGDTAVYSGNELIGFYSNGKFVSKNHYARYCEISNNNEQKVKVKKI